MDAARDLFSVKRAIPVVRMLHEAEAIAFYVDYLGFSIDWQHRFGEDPTSPLYMQVHLGGAFLHLNGHAADTSPASEVRLPVSGLQHYCEFLRQKGARYELPEVVDPRYSGRLNDMNLLDPSGNMLTFWSPDDPGLEMA